MQCRDRCGFTAKIRHVRRSKGNETGHCLTFERRFSSQLEFLLDQPGVNSSGGNLAICQKSPKIPDVCPETQYDEAAQSIFRFYQCSRPTFPMDDELADHRVESRCNSATLNYAGIK